MGNRSDRDNRRRSRSGRGKRRQKTVDPEKYPMPSPRPHRDYEPCPISGEPIKDILTAIAHPETGKPANLESVIGQLEQSEPLGEGERICYIGEGTFGVVKEEKERGKTVVTIRKRIEYEDSRAVYPWRKELSPGISRDYEPHPTPLSELYSPEDESSFPKFGRGGAVYMPRSN